MENKQFKHNKVTVDLITHCLEQKVAHPDLKVFIGTDSISLAGKIHYFTVVAFRYGKKGVHFIYTKEVIDSIRTKQGKPDVRRKLERECDMSMFVAEYLVEKGVFKVEDIIIELDYNNVVETLSKVLIPQTKGWAMAYGFQCLCKIPHTHNYPKRTPTDDMVCLGNPELDRSGRPVYPEDWTDVQVACKAANHLCQYV